LFWWCWGLAVDWRFEIPFFPAAGLAGILMPGLFYLNPNSSAVLVLFGDYKGRSRPTDFVGESFFRAPLDLVARPEF